MLIPACSAFVSGIIYAFAAACHEIPKKGGIYNVPSVQALRLSES